MFVNGTSPSTEFFWKVSGVDRAILLSPDCPESERIRFAAFGLLLVVGAAINFASGFLSAGFIFFPKAFSDGSFLAGLGKLLGSLVFAALWAAFMLNLFRLTIGLAGRHTDRLTFNLSDVLRATGIAALTFSLAAATACPLQVVLAERGSKTQALGHAQLQALEAARHADDSAIEALAGPLGQGQSEEDPKSVAKLPTECTDVEACGDYFRHTAESSKPSNSAADTPDGGLAFASAQVMHDRFDRLTHAHGEEGFFSRVFLAYDSNPLFSWTILLATWVLLALAPAIRMFTDRGAYDFLADQRKRQWLSAHGIEVDAHTVYSKAGLPIHVTAFHEPRRLLRQQQAEISSKLQQAMDNQTGVLRRVFDEMQVSKSNTGRAWASVRKRVVSVQVSFAQETLNVETLEGVVVANPGDAVITASTGESWPVARAVFEQRYSSGPGVAFGQPGIYMSRPVVVHATQMLHTFSIPVADGRSMLTGQAGDWLVDYGNGNQGVVAAEIFAKTYEVLEQLAPEAELPQT